MRSPVRPGLYALVVLVLSLGASGLSPAAQRPPDNDTVKALLRDRVATLGKIHELTLQGYKGGQVPLADVLAAQPALLNGRLDLCETNVERVKVYEEMVKLAEEMTQGVRKMAQGGQARGVDVLKAEVQLLDARIGLEKAKAAK